VEKTKEQRIRTEERRLNRIYKNLESQKKQVVVGLIKRAAYMRITLEDFEKDLDENGYTEKFQQGREQTPYDRKRPVAEMYTSMQALYQKAVKQLTDLLPKETTARTKSAQDDGFEDFVNDRYD
jgi:hypothetical protein